MSNIQVPISLHVTATTEDETLHLHDARTIRSPLTQRAAGQSERAGKLSACSICESGAQRLCRSSHHARDLGREERHNGCRSEEHTSELQSRENLVCRLLLEKKKTKY